MFGSPDDMSDISFSGNGSMQTVDDSDIARDAKRAHWHPLPWMPDTTRTPTPSQSKDTLIEPASSSSSVKTKKGFGNVKAKMRAVSKFLSLSKSRLATNGGGERRSVPIAGQLPPPIIVTDAEGSYVDQNHGSTRGDVQQGRFRNTSKQDKEHEKRKEVPSPVIETLRERLESEVDVPKPPKPPVMPQPPSEAMVAKKRYPNGPDSGVGIPRPERPRVRMDSPRPTVPPAIRVPSRPLPPTPVLPANHHPTLIPQQQDGGLGISIGVDKAFRPTITLDPGVDGATQTERFPALHRAHRLEQHDAGRLADELSSLVSLKYKRSERGRTYSAASSDTVKMDTSREAVVHWRPESETDEESATFRTPPPPAQLGLGTKLNPIRERTSSTKSSLQVEQSSDESEAVKRIQNWRVKVTAPASVVSSKAASAHSQFVGTDDGTSSHLTSISRSPLSKGNSHRSRPEEVEEDPQKTPTLTAKRVTALGKTKAHSYKSSTSKSASHHQPVDHEHQVNGTSKTSDASGTRHIARLTDSQFERLALAIELPLPSPIPRKSTLLPTPSTLQIDTASAEDDRRSSLDAPATTLSVLERKADSHLQTLDAMFRRHPDKMVEVLRKRPGLMLVVLLRCKVEGRISEANAERRPLVDLAPATSGGSSRSGAVKDGLQLLEESLIDLRFDDEEQSSNPQHQSHCGEDAVREVPSIVVSHHTGTRPLNNASSHAPTESSTPPRSSGTPTHHHNRNNSSETVVEVSLASLDPRAETTLREMVHHLERAGELSSIQQTLITLQDRLMSTSDDCSRLHRRLTTLEEALFCATPGLTPNTSFNNTASTFPIEPRTPTH